ncbi:MAG: TIGR02680 family protein, partial [Xanthobacteraceae bacterium]|nr:TIGR02680 family protein [Xanthobacteraceae bacterium]
TCSRKCQKTGAHRSPTVQRQCEISGLVLRSAILSRTDSVDTVGDLLEVVDRKAADSARATSDANIARGRLEQAQARLAVAEKALSEASDRLVNAWRRHFHSCSHVSAPDFEEIAEPLFRWSQSLQGDNPADAAFRAACREAQNRLASERADLHLRRKNRSAERDDIERQIAELRAGTFERPAAPPTRKAKRDGRAGQAFWQAVDFKDAVDENVRAGLEAALEASGLLDGWIMPDGKMFVGDAEHDVSLVVRRSSGTQTLDRYLTHCGDPSVTQAVSSILSSISSSTVDDDGEMWVSPEGCFRIGSLAGTWSKARAVYIGHTARERARLLKIEELGRASAVIADEIATLDASIGKNTNAATAVDEAEASAPSDGDVHTAHNDVGNAETEIRNSADDVQRLDRIANAAQRDLIERREAAELAAADTGLPPDKAALKNIRRRCDALSQDHSEAVGACTAVIRAEETRHGQIQRVQTASSRAEDAARAAETAEITAFSARQAYTTLEESVGDSVQQWATRISDAQRRKDDTDKAVKPANQALLSATEERTRAAESHKNAATELAGRTEERQRAADNLQGVAKSGLMRAGAPDVQFPDPNRTWTVEETRALAATLNQNLVDIRDSEANDPGSKVYSALTELQTALSPLGYSPHLDHVGDFGVVVAIADSKGVMTPAEALEKTTREVAVRNDLLTEGETKILEEHLQSEISVAIRNLLKSAEAYVERVNEEISSRPTSTGSYFQMRWIPLTEAQGAPAELESARKRLLNVNADLWTEKDRQAIGTMLQRRIREERIKAEESGGSSLREQLAAALDYRQWHRFVVERHAMGKWISISQPASSGERALGLTIAMLAAVASFYGDEHSARPRLVLLDEAFAGIDDGVRRHCMGLIEQFRLDFIITSEREWACYDTLPGVAICQLQRHDDFDAIYVSRWKWTGKSRVAMTEPARLMLTRA